MNFSENIVWNGRYLDYQDIRYFDYSASGFTFNLSGKKAVATIISDPQEFEEIYRGVLGINVTHADGKKDFSKVRLDKTENEIILFESKTDETVTIDVIRLSEAIYGYSGLKNLEIDGMIIGSSPIMTNGSPIMTNGSQAMTSKNVIVGLDPTILKYEIIGDSITCGYGIEGVYGKDVFTTMQERPDLAYAYLTMKKLNANFHLVSRSGIGLISCYADPETFKTPNLDEPLMSQLWPYTDLFLSKRLGIEPEVWDESRFSPDVVILHLGTNDNSWVRNLEDRRLSFVNLYEQMLEAIHRRSPKAKIVCCLGAMGQELCDSVEQALANFTKTFTSVKTKFVKFPLQDEDNDGVGTDWHPSAVTHEKMSELLKQALLQF